MRIHNILRAIGDMIQIAYLYISGFLMDLDTDISEEVRRIARFLAWTSLVIIVLFLFAILIKWVFLAYIVSMAGGIIAVVCFAIPDALLSAFSGIFGSGEIAKKIVEEKQKIEEEKAKKATLAEKVGDVVEKASGKINTVLMNLRKLLMPLLTVSLVCSFISTMLAIRGMDYFSWSNIAVWSAVGLFFIALDRVWPNEKHVFKKILTAILVFEVFSYYLMPTIAIASTSYVERKVSSLAASINSTDIEDNIRDIPKGTCLYNEDMKLEKIVEVDTKGKVMDTKINSKTGEDVHKIILIDTNREYMNEKNIYFVTTRSVIKVRSVAPNVQSDSKNVGNTSSDIITAPKVNQQLPRIDTATVFFPAKGKVTVPLYQELGDTIKFSRATTYLEQYGSEWWPIEKGINKMFLCGGSGNAVLRGCGEAGSVFAEIVHRYK